MADEILDLNHDDDDDDDIITTTTTFQRGDRVVVTILGRRRHGHVVAIVSSQTTCAIHLDSGNGKAKFQTVLISPNRMKHEQEQDSNENNEMVSIPLSCTIQNRATVTNAALVHGNAIHDGCPSIKYNAAAMNGIMYLIRWMVATNSYHNAKTNDESDQAASCKMYSNLSLPQIQQLSPDDCHLLNEIAIQNWESRFESSNDEKSDPTITKKPSQQQSGNNSNGGVHDLLVQYFQNQNITSGFIYEALSDSRAIRSWSRCIQTDVWFVGKDDTGTYVIPDCRSHEHVVYKVVGFGGGGPTVSPSTSSSSSNSALSANNDSMNRAPVRMIRIPMCLRITILPWYGRLLHDTSIPLPRSKESVRLATDQVTANRLHTVVLHAIENGTVIEHFAELETM